mmetsp:Transcript_9968/g.24912  ORF Transcript_9968/g.24912 Transcript_9968/m.24912 type:complete len:214 (-) Transcript_9968:516-1157(-)
MFGGCLVQLVAHRLGEVRGGGAAAQVARAVPALRDDGQDGLLQVLRLLGEAHVAQQHDARQRQRGGVGQVLARNVGRGAVHSLRQAHVVQANVGGGREAQAANEAGAQVGDDVAVQVGHDQHIKLGRVAHQLHARVVHNQLVVLDLGVLLAHLAAALQEQAVRLLHDVGLVHRAHLLAVVLLGVLEGKLRNTQRCLAGDDLQRLHHARHHLVL